MILHENLAKLHARMTTKSIMDDYYGRSIYITVAYFAEVYIQPLKHKKQSEAVKAPVKIVYITDECYSCLLCTHENNSDGSIIAIHYKPASWLTRI